MELEEPGGCEVQGAAAQRDDGDQHSGFTGGERSHYSTRVYLTTGGQKRQMQED